MIWWLVPNYLFQFIQVVNAKLFQIHVIFPCATKASFFPDVICSLIKKLVVTGYLLLTYSLCFRKAKI
jgi:hypothetical protein